MRMSRVARRMALATLLIAVGASALATSGFGQLGGGTITAARFSITVDGYEIASFAELAGFTTEVEAAEYLHLTDDGDIKVTKLAGKLKPPTVTLKRGMTNALEMWTWHEAVRRGEPSARRSVSLTAYNAEGQPAARWWLVNAWPSKLEVAELSTDTTRHLIETVTLTAESMQRVAP